MAHKTRAGAESGGGYKEEGEKLDKFLITVRVARGVYPVVLGSHVLVG